MTKLAGQTVTAADFGMRSVALPCVKASGLSLAGARVDATRVRVAAKAAVAGTTAGALTGNGFGAWDARRLERPLSASVAIMAAPVGGYGDATDAGTGAAEQQQSLRNQLHTQKIAAAAMTIRALRGPDPGIERT
jgi:hypothetical protein